MNKRSRQLTKAATALLAVTAAASSAHAQSADAIIDKLVEKGILTVKEANELRDEADKNFTSAYSVKSGMPDWVNSFKLNGDMRGRFEGFFADNPAFVDRNRFRYRLRFGATAVIKDNFEVGLRLSSSERADNFGGDPISGNTTFADNGSKKFIFLDLAYAKWSPINTPDWAGTFTIGKMENPFVFSDMVFDGEYTPEGLAAQFAYNINQSHALKLNAGGFILDELGNTSNDAYMGGAQLRFDSVWNPKVSTSLGVAALAIMGDDGLLNATTGTPYNGVPNINRGNSRTAIPPANASPAFGGAFLHNFNPIVADASLTYTLETFPRYAGQFPIRVAGEYMHNPAAPSKNSAYAAGITFGKSGKKGTWDISYRYKVLEADAWYEELVDSDFGAFYEGGLTGSGFGAGYGAGTNLKGHVIKATYSPYDSLTLGITYFMVSLIDKVPPGSDSDMGRLQVDAVWKF